MNGDSYSARGGDRNSGSWTSTIASLAKVDRRSSVPYQLFMLALCIYAIGAVALDRLTGLDPDVATILQYVDDAVCLVFLADFGLCLYQAKGHRWRYFATWGWLDLLSAIPALDAARVGRLARVFRIFRVLRGLRMSQVVAGLVLRHRAESTVLATVLAALVLTVGCSVAILRFEDVPGANIRSGGDAIWWAFATVTTVGYGDLFPVTAEGRIVASILMTAGIGLASTLAAFFAAWFLRPDRMALDREEEELRAEIASLRQSIDRLNAQGRNLQPPNQSGR